MIIAGRGIQALPINHATTTSPPTAAAAGGKSNNWFLGSPTKPKFVMIVGRYHVRAYPLRNQIVSKSQARCTETLQGTKMHSPKVHQCLTAHKTPDEPFTQYVLDLFLRKVWIAC